MLIAQLSDLHIRPEGVLYQGEIDAAQQLREAIAQLHRLDRLPDLVLITGDLTDEGHPDEYAALRRILATLDLPFLLIPGNHDQRENLRTAFSDHRYLPASGPLHYCIDDHPVRIIGLDATVPGEHHGHIDEAGLHWLESTLRDDTGRPTLIMLHHPPFVCGIPYMDEYRLMDEASLRAVVARFDHIEAVLCGHVHRPMCRRWAGTVVSTAPSTATQIDLKFRPDAEPTSHAGPRGFMLHLWHPAHGLVSHTCEVGAHRGPYPFA